MTFLNPFYLWFLPLITVPIIIHLLAKRKSKLIDFPSLKFLKLLEQDALRKFNIKQLILLIIRTLMILFIILAFARPGLDTDSGFGLHSGSIDLLIIGIDNTASNRSNFEDLDKKWLDEFGSELTGKGYKVLYSGLTDLQLHESIHEIESGFGDIYAQDFVERLFSQIDLDQYERRSFLWLGDGQDARLRLETLTNWNKYLLINPIRRDVSINNIKLPALGVRLNESYSMMVELGRSPDMQQSVGLELTINDKRQNQIAVEANMGAAEISGRVEESGYQTGQVILPADDASYNDERYFILPAAGGIPVQILRSRQIPDFWNIIGSAVKDQGINLSIRILDYPEVDNLDLSKGGTIIVDDASVLEAYNWNRLRTFISNGGQLIVFGNGGEAMTSILGFKSQLVEERNLSALGLFITGEATKQINTTPLKAIVEQNRLKVFKRFKSAGDELDETWVRYLDEQPFLGANKFGKGRIVWFNTEFGMHANNLPVLGMFPTLIIQLAQSQEIKAQSEMYNYSIGDTLHFYPTASMNQNTPYGVQRPDGSIDYLTPDTNYTLHYATTNLPGVYKLSRGRQILQPVAVNISTHEAAAHSKSYAFDASDIVVSNEQSETRAQFLKQGSNIAVWPFLFMLVFILMLIETYLSRIKATWRQNV